MNKKIFRLAVRLVRLDQPQFKCLIILFFLTLNNVNRDKIFILINKKLIILVESFDIYQANRFLTGSIKLLGQLLNWTKNMFDLQLDQLNKLVQSNFQNTSLNEFISFILFIIYKKCQLLILK